MLSKELFVLGKGKRLLTFRLGDQIELEEEWRLGMYEEIRQLHYDADAGVLVVVSGDGVRVEILNILS